VAAVEASLQALPDTPHGQLAIRAMRAGLAHLLEAQAGLHAQSRDDSQAAGAGAYDLLTMYGILAVGWAWAELPAVPGAPASKAVLARVWFEREMPLLAALRARIEAGPAALCALADDAV
jgi:hypothetical protein